MNMKAEDKVGPRDELKVFDHLGVARIRVDLLHPPVGKGMGRAGDEHKPMLLGQRNHIAAQVEEVFLGDLDIAAHPRSDFDDGLMHLGLDALFEAKLPLGQHLRRNVRAKIASLTGSTV